MEFSKKDLIREVQCRPVLWDRKNKAHKNSRIINTSWDEVAAALSSDRETVRKAWKNLVDQFRTNYKNVMRNMPPDITDHPDVVEHMFKNIRWAYFQQLLFLQDVVKTKRYFL
ncbi:transcription factor Adf-1-like [Centruroides sculpturatus]|uniref:transcription factor Adf-1-like n=1 Tax=Centruroides sculpturatus TaxID=218467 RepID=UPI000C6DDCFD|nr:transcription factor Adf-1-like [Centruroides sculpturatus]